MTPLKRGQVWLLKNGEYVLLISSDSFNAMRMEHVLALPIVEFTPGFSRLQVPFGVRGPGGVILKRLIETHNILQLERSLLAQPTAVSLGALMGKIEATLSSFFEPESKLVPKPSKYPQSGQMRMVDLQVPGGDAKPAVALSNLSYGERGDWQDLVLCRKTSKSRNLRLFEVPLSKTGGAAVVHDVRTWPTSMLLERSAFAPAVTSAEKDEILKALKQLLGLEAK